MPNPYEVSASTSLPMTTRRSVRGLLVVSTLSLACGVVTLLPAAVLLNQDWQIIPTDTYTSGIDFNGRAISNQAAITYSLTIGGFLILLGTVMGAFCVRNWRINRKI